MDKFQWKINLTYCFLALDAELITKPHLDDIEQIEAKAVVSHREELKEHKITPKGMLQIFRNEKIPYEVLMKVFRESLEE